MLGAIAGDIIGSIYEHAPIKHKAFALLDPHCTFTDDTVLTAAIAEAILTDTPYVECVRRFGRRYPDAGYGASFFGWLQRDGAGPYNSWGNGAAMRVSAVGFAFDSEDDVLRQAQLSAQITHDHPEGIKGAQATALAVFLARTGHDKATIRARIASRFGYDLDRTVDDIRPGYTFDVSCQGSVPEALIAFLDSHDYEDAVRNAVSLGGDADTLACIAGAVAEAFYGGVPQAIVAQVEVRLTPDLLDVTQRFRDAYR
jgi:ADP-ribosylglycohydrolase